MDHRLFTAEQARDIVMYRHEQTKKVFLYTARVLAVKVIKEKERQTLTTFENSCQYQKIYTHQR